MPAIEGGRGAPLFAAEDVFARQAAALRPVVRAVVACVLGEGKDHPDVEDCTHEALRRAIEGRARLREDEPLRPWLLGIARHVALDLRRLRRRGQREQSVGGGAEVDAPIEIVDPAPGPDERLLTREKARCVARALAGLSEAQREAMLLFHVEGKNYQEIAAQLEIPMGTVATWLARGRRVLAEVMRETE